MASNGPSRLPNLIQEGLLAFVASCRSSEAYLGQIFGRFLILRNYNFGVWISYSIIYFSQSGVYGDVEEARRGDGTRRVRAQLK